MRSGFFNDTEVWAEDFAEFAAGILTNGVLATTETALKVGADELMKVSVQPGYCWINGHFGHSQYAEVVELEAADSELPRIDRIVARCDLDSHAVYLHAIAGTPAAEPAPPSIVRDGTYYDLGLATVAIPAGTLTITDAMITDTRRDPTLCGGVYPSRSDAFIWPSANNIGDIKLTAALQAPDKWLLCQGQEISRTTYAELYATIGTTYGDGDGSTTFNLPDLTGRFIMGRTASGDYSTVGEKGGSFKHRLTVNEMPSHTHTVTGNIQITIEGTGQSSVESGLKEESGPNHTGSYSLQNGLAASTGGNQEFTMVQPYITMNYIIYTGV